MSNLKYLFFALIACAVLLEVIADVLFKKWALEHKTILFIIGLAIYTLGTLFWAYSLKYEYLSRAITIFTILNLVIITLAGVLIFKENITLVNKIGIGLGILRVVLIEL